LSWTPIRIGPGVHRFSHHFVLGFTYDYERMAGVLFKDGGWERLASEGYFATLVLDPSYVPLPSMLAKYTLVDEYQDAHTDLKFYRRIGPEP
jgi:hypothetical protein